MYHVIFEPKDRYDIAVLCKTDALNKESMLKHYVEPTGLSPDKFIAFSLEYDNPKKVSTKAAKEYLTKLLPVLEGLGVKYLYCTDGNYFKVLTKQTKAETHYGYVLPCAIPEFEYMQVVLSTNHRSIFFSDDALPKIGLANTALTSHYNNSYTVIGADIIHYEKYIPSHPLSFREALAELHKYDSITVDTETFSLRHSEAGLGTIGFAWSKNEGICLDVEHYARTQGVGIARNKAACFEELRIFFETYKGNLKFHNATFDIKILIYNLWMGNLTDTEGLLRGLEILTRDFDDTKIISYLALNSCGAAKGYLSLKHQSHEFAGNYAESDINDITLINNKALMRYNLIDCLATWYVYEKNYPIMVKDDQLDTYTFFKKILKNIIQMELTGMPLNMVRVKEAEQELLGIIDKYTKVLNNSNIIKNFSLAYRMNELSIRQAKLKKKILTLDDIHYEFNTGSGPQLIDLIHGYLGFEVYALTKTKLPAVGAKHLKGHMLRTDDQEIKDILEAIIKIEEGKKILGTFINKFLEAPEYDGWHYLFGSFNLGGTKSGRLSSSNPNLQNLPSGSTYGKLVKSCFQAPPGWLFVGLDYASLEDRINTLLTKDPNKIKVYTDGFDGHSYRAVSYWKELFPNVDPNDPAQVNAIVATEEGEKLRGKSKAPTFLLTYLGTWMGLVVNCGFSEKEAKAIEANYHNLYSVSTAWVKAKLEQASIDGYVKLAFGLKLRTPILAKTLLGNSYTPRQASAESRTAGNAVSGQSWCLLLSRAAVELQERTIVSKHRLDVRPTSHIHDAAYFMIRDNLESLKWLNDNLVDCISWQDADEIRSDDVKLTGNLGIFYPNWANEVELPNYSDYRELLNVCKKGKEAYLNK